jgi:spore coat polysaccharide biosynthesis protein SpsF
MSVIAIIQARLGSTRLRGKVLLELAGAPVLARVVNRCRRAATLDDVLVATTILAADDPIAALCRARNWQSFRGQENDVLDRYYHAALQHRAEVVVRITSDCPLIDGEVIDLAVRTFLSDGVLDYASNSLSPRTFPRGLDVEVFSFEALSRAWREDHNPAWREHVTPYIYRHPEKFRLLSVVNETDLSSMRWTVDTPEDLVFVRKIYDHFGHDAFSWREVLDLLERHPDWLAINRGVIQKEVA